MAESVLKIRDGDIARLEREFKALPKHIALNYAKKGLVNAGELVKIDTKTKIGTEGLIKTGELRKSIQVKENVKYRGHTLLGVDVIAKRGKRFPGGYYAHLKERGHKLYRTTRWRKIFIKHVPARPFMRPTADSSATQSKAVESYRIAVKRGIESHKANAA